MKKMLHRLYVKVHLSDFSSRLDDIDQLYDDGYLSEYIENMAALHADLAQNTEVSRFLNNGDSSSSSVLAQMGELIKIRDTKRLRLISTRLQELLEQLQMAQPGDNKGNNKFKRSLLIAMLVVPVFLALLFSGRLKARYSHEKETYRLMANQESFKRQIFDDINSLNEALKQYYNDHQSYPKTVGMQAAVMADGKTKSNWIEGLAPEYIQELPVDPRKSNLPEEQYMYISDGKDYKLIAHRPLGIEEISKSRPQLMDPTRPSWAFGFWTDGAKSW